MSGVQTQSSQQTSIEEKDEDFASLAIPHLVSEQPVQPIVTDPQIDRRGLLLGCVLSFFGGMPLGIHLARDQLQRDKYQLWINEDYYFYFSEGATGTAFDDCLLSCRKAPNSDALIVTQEKCGGEGRFEHWLYSDGRYMRSLRLGSSSFREDGFYLTRGRGRDFTIVDDFDLEVLAGVLHDRRTQVYRGRPGELVFVRKVMKYIERLFRTPQKTNQAEYRPQDTI